MFKQTKDQETKETLYSEETVKDYQEQIIQTYRNVIDNYLESQKQILDSLQLSWSPIIYNIYRKLDFGTIIGGGLIH
jgi:site-specific DNA-adenine methylase